MASRQNKAPQKALGKGESVQAMDGQLREKLKAKFRALDKNNDGSLTINELRELLMKSSKSRLSESEVRALFRQADKDKNGRIDFDEFVDYLWSKTADSAVSFEHELPLGGGGLQLGGKLGNVVVKPGFVARVKTGWRVIAINGFPMDPTEVRTEFERLNRSWQRCSLMFELDEQSKDSAVSAMESRRTRALREIKELTGCSEAAMLSELTPERRAELLQDRHLACMLVEAHAVDWAAILLDHMPAEGAVKRESLVQSVRKCPPSLPEVDKAIASMEPQDLLRRDGDGNVPLHFAKSEACVKMLVERTPDARNVVNIAGRTPLNERLVQGGIIFDCDLDIGPDKSVRDALLCCDTKGICAAMRTYDDRFQKVAAKLRSWEEVRAALESDTARILRGLETLGGEHWPGLIAFHCFRDVMKEGCHTEVSWTRLTTVWECIHRLLECCLRREERALAPAKALLRATKGPCCPPIDMRLPYRLQLVDFMGELQRSTGDALSKQYDHLNGHAATWLKYELRDNLCADFVEDALVGRGLQPKLRMDFELVSGTSAAEKIKPPWIQSATPDFQQLSSDLVEVGMVGQSNPDDIAYDTLRLAGMDDVDQTDDVSEHSDALTLTRLYGAYLRGVCQGQQKQVTEAIRLAIGEAAVIGETLIARTEAKSFPRILAKTMEAVGEIKKELAELGVDYDEQVDYALQTTAALVVDVNGVTLIGETPEDLQSFFEMLDASLTILRIKNTYNSSANTSAGYRDIKVWPCVETDVGMLVVEVQLILAAAFAEKKYMHLPYAFLRGDFDWDYLSLGPSAEELFCTGWRLFHGIEGAMEESDMKQAKESCIGAAKRGHFLARGMCHKQGWGVFGKNHEKALDDFAAAAEAGRREGKCKLGVNLINAVSNAMVNRDRGLKLLFEAADEGELEAMYQLGLCERDYRDQKAWLDKAARSGHRRAFMHPLMASRTGARLRVDV